MYMYVPYIHTRPPKKKKIEKETGGERPQAGFFRVLGLGGGRLDPQ